MTTSSPELPRCDTELSLSHLAPARPRYCATGEKKQNQNQKQQAAAAPCWCGGGGGGLTATELQAMAILRVATRAAAEELGASGDGGTTGLSMRRSMEWFLQRRREREARRKRGADADADSATAASTSSSSFSCLTDTTHSSGSS